MDDLDAVAAYRNIDRLAPNQRTEVIREVAKRRNLHPQVVSFFISLLSSDTPGSIPQPELTSEVGPSN